MPANFQKTMGSRPRDQNSFGLMEFFGSEAYRPIVRIRFLHAYSKIYKITEAHNYTETKHNSHLSVYSPVSNFKVHWKAMTLYWLPTWEFTALLLGG